MFAIVLGPSGVDALAQVPGAAADSSAESKFKGVVVNVTPLGVTVKGEIPTTGRPAAKSGAASKAKSEARSVFFAARGAKTTRGGWRSCELTDMQKGDTVTVTFSRQGRAKLVASHIDIAEETPADTKAILAKAGKLLFEDDFGRAQIPPKWRLGKGFWEIQEGTVVAAENPADNHGAYAYADPRFPYKDIVAQFSFKFAGSTNCHFMMEDSNYKGAHAGHIIRATITPTSANVADSKLGAMKNEIYEKMKDPKTTDEEKKQIQASIKDKSASFKVTVDDQWHQARVEVVGDEMLLSIDNRPVAYLKSEGVDHPTKNMVGFTVGGKSLQLDNVKVWEATVQDDWSKIRSEVQAALRK